MKFRKNWKRFWTLDRHHAEGFTLVELIVVIAILAILAGVGTVGYSGYVKKAERANDEALLAELNTAFVSACMANGENNIGRTDVDATLSDGSFTYTAPFKTEFDGFYEEGKFKVFEALIYNAKTGQFMETTKQNAELYRKLRTEYGAKIALFAASNLGLLGAETLLTEVGSVVSWAAGFNLAALGGAGYMNALKSYLGLGADATDEAVRSAMMELAGNDPELANQIGTNAIALYAAQNTATIDQEGILSWLDGSKDTNSLQNDATAKTLAEAAAIYGLYMSYKGDDFDNKSGNTLDVMNAALADTDFAAWVKTDAGKAELDAYMAAMKIIDGATDDEETRNDVLTNGFDDDELIALMESLMGN